MDIRLSPAFIFFYLAMLTVACWPAVQEPAPLRSPLVAPLVLLCVGLSAGAICLLNYLFWNPVGLPYVDCLQGRYLIPLAPAVLVLLKSVLGRLPRKWWMHWPDWRLDAAAAATVLGACAYTVAAVYMRYYAGT